MADRDVAECVTHLEERMCNAEFTIREIGENSRSQLDAMRQELYRSLDAMSKEVKEVRTHMYAGLTLVASQ